MTIRNLTAARKTFGAGALVALAVLFIGVTILITFVLRGARIDLTESKLYSIAPGTQRIVSFAPGAHQPLLLLLAGSERGVAAAARLRATRARVAGRNGRALQGQGQAHDRRSQAVLGRRRPRRGVRPAGRAAGRAQRLALLRSRRHELDRRPRSHRVLPAGQGRVPRVRRGEPDSSARQPEEADRRRDLGAAGRGTVRPAVRAHEPGLGQHRAAARADAGALARARRRRDRAGREHAAGRASQGAVGEDAVRDRPVRHARRQADGVRRSAIGERPGRPAGWTDVDGAARLHARPAAGCVGRRVRPGQSARRSRPRPHGLAAPGRAALAARGDRRA